MYRNFFKRFFDLFFSLALFLFLLPIASMVFFILLIYYKGSPFFYQKRPGLNAVYFSVIKFKSMRNAFDENGHPLPDKDRLTKIGAFLRKTSLDEMPQLINVIKGDMSFVGPRPLLIKYLPYYSEREFNRHKVRPGITGLAQINGRNFSVWKDRLEFDAQYVESLSFSLDIHILIKTVLKVVKGDDVKIIPDGIDLDVYRQREGFLPRNV